jgi:F420-non-reducing hydrogenase small subunit
MKTLKKALSMSKTTPKAKLKIAVYWGAACGGCCVSVLDIHEKLFNVLEAADLVFWPIAMDTKYKDIENMADQSIDLTLFNGAIRNSENERLAKLLRKKSKILIAYGACAHMGGIPGLANFSNRESIFSRVYLENESTNNPDGTIPVGKQTIEGLHLHLPEFYQDVFMLKDIVDVDYFIPGCPPQSERLVEILEAVFSGAALPPKGSVIGAQEKSLCEECKREKTDNKRISKIYRSHEIIDDFKTCFLEQGVICMGPATRGGCGTRCITGNAPCRGCYGPPADVIDPGAKMMSAIATMVDADNSEDIERIIEGLPDPAGTFYRFSLPASILRRTVL